MEAFIATMNAAKGLAAVGWRVLDDSNFWEHVRAEFYTFKDTLSH